MTTFDEILKIFKNSKDVIIEEDQLIAFCRSIEKSVTYSYVAGRYALAELLKTEERDQWPVLKRIDDPGLDIYNNVEKEPLSAFISSIRNEEEIRSGKSELNNTKRTLSFREGIYSRTELYTIIFKFTEKDIAYCARAAERYRRKAERKRKERILKAFGIGAGILAAGGAGVAVYTRHKKEKNKK